jgi:tRNA/rRNA methyltransferase
MGSHRLHLIAPRCEINDAARKGAAGAQEWLDATRIYKSWESFYQCEGSGLRLAFTRRTGRKRHVADFKEALEEVFKHSPEHLSGNIYLIFGPEDHGLNTEDLSMVNFRCHLPVYGPFPSMNLSQAVLLAQFILAQFLEENELKTHHKANTSSEATGIHSLDNPKPLFFPEESLKEWITTMGFDVRARKASAIITLRRLLLRNTPNEDDLRVLDAILQQNIRKLRKSLKLNAKNE